MPVLAAKVESGIIWDVPPKQLADKFNRFGERLRRAIEEAGLDVAVNCEIYAKQNHPWTNRTGAAERGLTGDVTWEDHKLLISLAQTAENRQWLEWRWGGKWAIILPTLQLHYGILRRRLDGLMDKAK